MVVHPCPDDEGKPVHISSPSTPTPLFAWLDPSQSATVVPGGPMPHDLNGVPFRPWLRPPSSRGEWTRLAEEMTFDEPPFTPKKKPAAGAVVVEPDGRVWLVSPTNAHGGYKQTFAKGTVKHLSLKATALKEVFEESGLRVELLAHLIDVDKTQSSTRYYLARRIGGTPSDMGWESQSAHLVPLELVKDRLNMVADHTIADRLMEVWGTWAGSFREPIRARPANAHRRVTGPPDAAPPPVGAEGTPKWASHDGDAIAGLASAALNANKPAEAIRHCKHAAVVFHHQGKTGLAVFFARLVNKGFTQIEGTEAPPSVSSFEDSAVPPGAATIHRQNLPVEFPIFEPQARFTASLIFELEEACLRTYGFRDRREIHWSCTLSPDPYDLPEFRRFLDGTRACGFVVEGLPPEEWLDLDATGLFS